MSLNVELLEQSFEKIKPRADEFAASFYENLFKLYPEVKPLFANTEMAKQQKKLLNSLVLVVENLRSPETLEPVLNALGGRHIGYGAIANYYPAVGEALLISFEQYLQEDWTIEVKQAWIEPYGAITTLMLKGTGVESSSEEVQLTTEIILETQMLKSAGVESFQEEVQDEKEIIIKNTSEIKAQLLNESQQLQLGIDQQKKPLILIQLDGEVFKGMLSKLTDNYQQFQAQSFVQRLGEVLKGILEKFVNNFWMQPAWLVATVSAVLFIIIYVGADDNSIIGEILEGADALSLVVALVLFIKEAPDRRKQFHYQAWSTVDAAHNVKVSYARILALQDLNEDNVSLRGLDASGAELIDINLPGANLSHANLNKSDLSNANLNYANLDKAILSHAKLSGANLTHAKLSFAQLNKVNFSSADLSSANLICADLKQANLSGAILKNASLSGANLEGAYLTGANLTDAKVSLYELKNAFLEGAIMPDGSKYELQNQVQE